jgi:predicted NBD/HSP70 family sugar kinase
VADVRPIQTTIAVADVNGRFLSQEAMLTPGDPQTAATSIAAKLKHLMQTHAGMAFQGVGISIPGRFDQVTHRVMFTPNLKWPQFDLFDLKGPIEKATGISVQMENAANACVLAEVWFGHMEKVRDMVVVTIAEGVGTGIFSNGQLTRGLNGMAGEFGHVPLDPNGPLCTCGGKGCWEVYASNRAALRYYHESSPTPYDMNFQDLLALAEGGDELALRALDKMAHAIGKGLRMVVAGLAPEEIVIAGEFARLWDRFGPVIENEVAASVLVGNPPRVRPASDPGVARLRGTVALVLQKHFGPTDREVGQSKFASTM